MKVVGGVVQERVGPVGDRDARAGYPYLPIRGVSVKKYIPGQGSN